MCEAVNMIIYYTYFTKLSQKANPYRKISIKDHLTRKNQSNQ